MNEQGKENDLSLAFAVLTQGAYAIAVAQKKYFDSLIGQGFSESQALYLTYHYDPLIFSEQNGSSGDGDDSSDSDGYEYQETSDGRYCGY